MYYVSKDHLGSNRLVEDEHGNAIAQYNFKPYGELGSASGSNQSILSYLYTGQEYDTETGLYNYRARLYDPTTKRFTSVDPIKQTASPYVYVNNNSINFNDPSGESFFGDLFSWIAQVVIDVVEVVAAVAIDVVTDGAATPLTGGLLGAGLNGVVYDVNALATHESPGWKGFAEAQTIGAVTGAATAGFGELGGAAEKGIQTATEDATTTAGKVASYAAKKGANIGIQAVGGAATGVVGKLIENGFDGKPAGEGLGTEALVGFISAGVGSTIGQVGDGIVGDNPTLKQNIIKSAIAGTIGGAAGALIAVGIEKEK